MAEKGKCPRVIAVSYDDQADILTFTFTEMPQPAVAEEVADEVQVRYDPQTRRVFTVDVLNFSARVRAAFGPTLTYTERTESPEQDAPLSPRPPALPVEVGLLCRDPPDARAQLRIIIHNQDGYPHG